MKEQALLINPFIEIGEFCEGVTIENIEAFLENVDVVLDGLDFFNFDIRRLLFKKAKEKGIYVVTAAPLGFSSALLVFSPFSGMGFDDYFHIVKDMTPEEQYLAFAMGLAPKPTHISYMDLKKVSLESKTGPSLNVACLACSSIAGTKAIQIILNKGKIKPVPHYIQFDPYLMKFRKGKLFFGNKNPVQRLKTCIVKYILNKNKSKHLLMLPEMPSFFSDTEIISDSIIDFLLKAGIQAPSGDNCQPWKFTKLKNVILLTLDRKSDESFFNINQIATIISCGAVIENIIIAASSLGIQTDVNYLPGGHNDDRMAKLEFSFIKDKNSFHKDVLFDSIWKRNTDRQAYRRSPVSSILLDKIKESIFQFSGAQLNVVTEKDKIKNIAKMIYMVDQIRTQNKSLHEHLHRMIRYTDQEVENKRDGLPLKNLDAGLSGELFLKYTKPWCVMNTLNKVGISKLAAFHSYKRTIQSSGIALLTVNKTDNASFLMGGRALERAWLTFTHLGLSVQPMTAITLFWLRWMLKGENQFSSSQQTMLIQVWNDFQKMFADVDFKVDGLVMLFRFGFSDPITTGTLRKKVSDFIGNKHWG